MQRQLKLMQKDLTSSLSYITIKHWKIEDQIPAMDWQNRKSVFIWNTCWRVSNCCVTYFIFPTETGKNQSEPNSLMRPTAEDTLTYYTVARRGNYSSGCSSAKLCRAQNLLNLEDWPTAGCLNIIKFHVTCGSTRRNRYWILQKIKCVFVRFFLSIVQ